MSWYELPEIGSPRITSVSENIEEVRDRSSFRDLHQSSHGDFQRWMWPLIKAEVPRPPRTLQFARWLRQSCGLLPNPIADFRQILERFAGARHEISAARWVSASLLANAIWSGWCLGSRADRALCAQAAGHCTYFRMKELAFWRSAHNTAGDPPSIA